MRLYPKELHSIKALEAEKRKLSKQLRELDEEDMFSIENITNKKQKGKKKDSEPAEFDIVTTLLSFLPVSHPLLAPAIKIAQKFIFRNKEEKQAKKAIRNYVSAEPYHEEIGHKVKRVAKSAAFELLTGYLKWKAIELTYKGAKHLIQQRKEKKQAAL